MTSALTALRTNRLQDFSTLSFLSAFGLLCVVLVCFVVAYELFTRPEGGMVGYEAVTHEWAVPAGLPMATSTMLAGLSGHVSLPPMFSAMQTPEDFSRTLGASFGIMFGIYALVGLCGYALFGDASSVLITTDMSISAGGWLSTLLVSVVICAMTIKLVCSMPLCVIVVVDIADNLYHEQYGVGLSEAAMMRWRLGTWMLGVIVAYAGSTFLEYVTALIGINSLFISVLLPIVSYWLLHADVLERSERAWLALVALIMVLVAGMIIVLDAKDFMQKLQSLQSPVDAACIAHLSCTSLKGDCCPTAAGVMLDCCGH